MLTKPQTTHLEVLQPDQISEQLKYAGLEVPSISSDTRYKMAWAFLTRNNIPMSIIKDYDFSTLSLNPSDFTVKAQVRAGNVVEEKVATMAVRMKGGERIKKPVIAVVDNEGNIVPIYGNHRSRAARRAGITSTIIIIGVGMTTRQRLLVCHKIGKDSNLDTGEDTMVDTTEDIQHQMKNEWSFVEDADLDSNCALGQEYRNAHIEYVKKEGENAEEFKKEYLIRWLFENKSGIFLSCSTERGKKVRAGQIYEQAWNHSQVLGDDEYDLEQLQEIYNKYWSHKELNEETGEEEEQFLWNHNKNKLEFNNTVAHILADGGNPLQDTKRMILTNKHSGKIDDVEEVHILMRHTKNTKNLKTVEKAEKTFKDKWAEFNNNVNTKDWNLPKVRKIIFLQHLTEDHKETAWEWQQAGEKGFFMKKNP